MQRLRALQHAARTYATSGKEVSFLFVGRRLTAESSPLLMFRVTCYSNLILMFFNQMIRPWRRIGLRFPDCIDSYAKSSSLMLILIMENLILKISPFAHCLLKIPPFNYF